MAKTTFDVQPTDDLQTVQQNIRTFTQKLGPLAFATNLGSRDFPSGVQQVIAHGLGYVPGGFLPHSKSAAGDVFGTYDAQNLYLTASAALSASILVW